MSIIACTYPRDPPPAPCTRREMHFPQYRSTSPFPRTRTNARHYTRKFIRDDNIKSWCPVWDAPLVPFARRIYLTHACGPVRVTRATVGVAARPASRVENKQRGARGGRSGAAPARPQRGRPRRASSPPPPPLSVRPAASSAVPCCCLLSGQHLLSTSCTPWIP